MKNHNSILSAAFLCLSLIFLQNNAQGVPTVFSLDPNQSQLTLSGTANGSPFVQQGPGSLTTVYTGNINADVSASTIQFTGSSIIDARTNGVWQPLSGGAAGSAPADYGARATVNSPFGGVLVNVALRNVTLDVTSPVLTIINNNFNSSALLFSFNTNSSSALDYNASISSGSLSLAGLSTNKVNSGASLTNMGGTQKITIPVDTDYVFNFNAGIPVTVLLHLTGQLVATSAAVPIFRSIVVTNQTVVLTVENATPQSELQTSVDLTNWFSFPVTVTNILGRTVFTAIVFGPVRFYRLQ
ncbi:MAG: hypothetical protein M3Y82_08940 [Verrucomicrobiota bacterium]|nr:hypothetical protein [Verrucomicrobiota bacterium]